MTVIVHIHLVTLIPAFVSSRYGNGLLYGLPAYQLDKPQRVQNAAARLIFQEFNIAM